MTDRKKPATRSGRKQLQAAPLAPQPDLTPDELIVLAAYRATDDKGRNFIAKITLSQARQWPCRIVPSLRLINGGRS